LLNGGLSILIETLLIVSAAFSSIFGVLTLTSKEKTKKWWNHTSSIAKVLLLNIFITLGLSIEKVYFDNIENEEKKLQIKKLDANLNASLSKQNDLKFQLKGVKLQLQAAIEAANEKELQYYKEKELQAYNNWVSAFRAEQKLNRQLLYALSIKMSIGERSGFLLQPKYLKVYYLSNFLKSPNTASQSQLEQMALLYSYLNTINDQIQAGSNAVAFGNKVNFMDITKYYNIEENAKYAYELYNVISSQL